MNGDTDLNSTETTPLSRLRTQDTKGRLLSPTSNTNVSPHSDDDFIPSLAQTNRYSVGEYIHPDSYTIFQHPDHLENDAKTIEKVAKESTRIKVRTRLTRAFNIFSIPFFGLCVNEVFKRDNIAATDLSFTFGVGIFCMTVAFFSHFFVILSGICDWGKTPPKYLYRIYSLNYQDPQWAGQTFTFCVLQFPYHAITSISELSAVMGGTAHTLLLVTSSYTFGILGCAVIAQHYYESDHEWTADTLLVLIGCFGLTLVGSFELDQLSPIMMKFHVCKRYSKYICIYMSMRLVIY